MRVLIIGADGFVGRHLIELLKSRHSVFATFQKKQLLIETVDWRKCDITKRDQVDELVRHVQPEQVYHLAARSNPVESFAAARAVYDTNFWGTFNILEATRKFAPHCRVLFAGSAQGYGRPNELPIPESHELKPESPYAVSKAAGDLLCHQYFLAHGLNVIRTRPFNHTGPGQDPSFVCSHFAQQVAAIDLELQEPKITVGNLSLQRDFSDVRDVVQAYELLLERGRSGEPYNVGSGAAVPLQQVLNFLLSLTSKEIEIDVDTNRFRPGEPATVYGDIGKITLHTSWRPAISLSKTLTDLYDSWHAALTVKRPVAN